jgi:hypothetical protein
LIGYVSSSALLNDMASMISMRAMVEGRDAADLIAETEGLSDRDEQFLIRAVAGRPQVTQEQLTDWKPKIDDISREANEMWVQMAEVQAKGVSNTTRYLTWDYMDVYVATSMRNRWEFEETYRLVERVFNHPEVRRLNVRWFDPTQSFENSVTDKGLVEALMLKRARCTVYMAQESDTLGKDSELAATLAQGKPVIAYVRKVQTDEELSQFVDEVTQRPIGYYRKRLLSLLAEEACSDPAIGDRLERLNVSMEGQTSASYAQSLIATVDEMEQQQTFTVVGGEALRFRDAFLERNPNAPKFMAAVESVWMDRRADTLQRYHPLAMQVHLETGVANGVFVVRAAEECARLIVGLLTNRLEFEIGALIDQESRLGTILTEAGSRSRFRIVTTNDRLTNSFWNFYLTDRHGRST